MNISKFHQNLLSWYQENQRPLPWRDVQGQAIDSYGVWVSEIMLQQTVVATVRPYYQKFMALWPTVYDLAAASLQDVLYAWQGLGYYSRARNLHRCAQVLVADYNGVFPTTEDELLSLPGIGPYTAAAITSIAFNRPATVVDGNIERVISRLFQIETPLPHSKKEISDYACHIRSEIAPSMYAQALMDLGAMVCTPKNPKCLLCPLSKLCAVQGPNADLYPKRAPKKKRPIREGIFYWITNDKKEVLLIQRPDSGLFGGLFIVPSVGWDDKNRNEIDLSLLHDTTLLPETFQHIFTHFTLKGRVYKARTHQKGGLWVPIQKLGAYPFPSVMKKVMRLTQVKAPV